MKLLSLWPWYSLALLFLNVALGIAALISLLVRRAVPRLLMLRVYVGYSVAGGLLGFAVAAAVPVGSPAYWRTLVTLSVGYDALLFLACAEVVDHLIRRDDVRRVKALWLLGLPVAFVITILVHNSLMPLRSVPALLGFDSLAALIAALCLIAVYITPGEDWLPGYQRVTFALAFQIVALALANLVFIGFRFRGVDIFGPLASALTLALLLRAAARGN